MEPFYRGVGNYSFKHFSRKEVQCKPFLKGLETMIFLQCEFDIDGETAFLHNHHQLGLAG